MSSSKLRVLLTNDDGPPGPDSPYIYGLYKHLTQDLGWKVKVVVPSSQKSWIGSAYQIQDVIHSRYYYPRDPDGMGDTPATCANIGLHNLYHGDIDLVLSGPNLGANVSSAFSLCSGTIGAALSSSLSKTRAVALSYGSVQRPAPSSLLPSANALSGRIVQHLWSHWGSDDGGIRSNEIDLYCVNVPVIEEILSEEGLPIAWTRTWKSSYTSLFKAYSSDEDSAAVDHFTSVAGPDGMSLASDSDSTHTTATNRILRSEEKKELIFKFSPEKDEFIDPKAPEVEEGTDVWAIGKGYVSVTPLRANFAEPPAEEIFGGGGGGIEGQMWIMDRNGPLSVRITTQCKPLD
ncbi:sure-like protein [Stereum hirsutum FP-91666 SS1]|uniref:sure-like protein n=1 Tax=Stereum hirsutum (strain FP-91666) TaxID=721885 RepID=UPI000440D913|nr:sure-like protein [Stereum hirsutum FP-91666 SS1]EIM87883.1 sure-like protein [Stereum hirsutum FP-91666 SS1]